MRVAVDAYPLVEGRTTGISNYVGKVLEGVLELDGDNSYDMYARYPLKYIPGKCSVVGPGDASKGESSFKNTLWLFSSGVLRMKQAGTDVFFGTRQMIPPFTGRMKKLLVVYDLVWHYYPQTMGTYNRIVLGFLGRRSIEAADHIISISDSTTESLVEVTGVARDKITTAYPAADGYESLDRDESARFIADKYGVSERYCLAVGTVEPRKNIAFLLEVFAGLKGRGGQLLVCGAKGWKSSPVYDEFSRLGLTEQHVKFLGYVPQEDMNRLYSGAGVLLSPSLYEGFAMPVLEAMSSGTPAVLTPACGVAGLVGDAAVIVEPDDTSGWIHAVESIINDSGKRDELSQRGMKIAKAITWSGAATKVRKALDSLYENNLNGGS